MFLFSVPVGTQHLSKNILIVKLIQSFKNPQWF